MKFDKQDIGVKIIETITSGLYDGNLNCLREYVQNSIDAKATKIDINLRNGGNDLEIRDDGHGMDRAGIKRALEIGISYKDENDIGWRGIGFWSGVPASKSIVVISKRKDGNPLRIEIDNDMLREEVRGNRPATDVLSDATGDIEGMDQGASDPKGDHFTLVRLESILPTQRGLFNEVEIRNYLSRTIPAPFNEKKFRHAKEIERILNSKGVQLPDVRIDFEGKRVFRPPTVEDIFIDEIAARDFEIDDELVATGWFLTTNQNRVPSSPNSGVFFKKKGFTIGDENLFRKQSDKTYSQWQYGEIHIISKEVVENAARNNFEYNARFTQPFLDQVRDFIPELQIMNRYASTKMAPSELARARKALSNGDSDRAKDAIRRLNAKLSREPGPSFPQEPSLQLMKRAMDRISTKHSKAAAVLEKKLHAAWQGKKSDVELAREHLRSVMNSLPAGVRRELLKHTKRDGVIDPSVNLTDVLASALRKKASLPDYEMHVLTKKAFDWESVQGLKGSKGPILTIVGPFDAESDDEKDRRLAARNRRFGVMVYAIHDLLVNPDKHSKGELSFAWLEKSSKAEQLEMTASIFSMIGFANRLIERSQRFTP